MIFNGILNGGDRPCRETFANLSTISLFANVYTADKDAHKFNGETQRGAAERKKTVARQNTRLTFRCHNAGRMLLDSRWRPLFVQQFGSARETSIHRAGSAGRCIACRTHVQEVLPRTKSTRCIPRARRDAGRAGGWEIEGERQRRSGTEGEEGTGQVARMETQLVS